MVEVVKVAYMDMWLFSKPKPTLPPQLITSTSSLNHRKNNSSATITSASLSHSLEHKISSILRMDPDLGQNRVEDVGWLCSLSESELDLLISLKKLVLEKARKIGHAGLAEKFDLKVLRALAFILMTCIKNKVVDVSLVPGFEDSDAFTERCNLLKCDLGDAMSLEEIKACIGIPLAVAAFKRELNSEALKETTVSQKKRKSETK